jgi:Flp pilus assembly pilin Flp
VVARMPGEFSRRLAARESGTALTEVGLLLFFIAVVAVTMVSEFGDFVATMYERAVGMFVH